jgi:hypothetical protein
MGKNNALLKTKIVENRLKELKSLQIVIFYN